MDRHNLYTWPLPLSSCFIFFCFLLFLRVYVFYSVQYALFAFSFSIVLKDKHPYKFFFSFGLQKISNLLLIIFCFGESSFIHKQKLTLVKSGRKGIFLGKDKELFADLLGRRAGTQGQAIGSPGRGRAAAQEKLPGRLSRHPGLWVP